MPISDYVKLLDAEMTFPSVAAGGRPWRIFVLGSSRPKRKPLRAYKVETLGSVKSPRSKAKLKATKN